MATTNSHDYARAAKISWQNDVNAERLARDLDETSCSYEMQADLLAGYRCPTTIGLTISKILRNYKKARVWLPALHAHQIALWFKANESIHLPGLISPADATPGSLEG